MFVATAKMSLHFPQVQSLKEKRQILSSIIKKLRLNYNAAVAEVGCQDKWQVAEVGVAVVSGQQSYAEELIHHILRWIEEDGRSELTGIERQVY